MIEEYRLMEEKVRQSMSAWTWRVKRLDMTLSDFAAAVNVSEVAFNEYRSGKTIPSAVRYLLIETTFEQMEKAKGIAA